MQYKDHTFTFEGYNFCATYETSANGVEIEELLLESGIDDELIPVTDKDRLTRMQEHLEHKHGFEIECYKPRERYENINSGTYRPGI
jgi:hypothetical protein